MNLRAVTKFGMPSGRSTARLLRISMSMLSLAMVLACDKFDIQGTHADDAAGLREARLVGEGDPEARSTVLVRADLESEGHICSGTLISPHVILTAAHCLCASGSRVSSAGTIDIHFGVAPKATGDDHWVPVNTINIIKNYAGFTDGLAQGEYNDIALLGFATPAFEVFPVGLARAKTDLHLKSRVLLAGFGPPLAVTDNEKVALHLRSVRELISHWEPSPNQWALQSSPNYKITTGDSGGSVYLETRDGLKLAGVISTISTFESVARHAKWIDASVKQIESIEAKIEAQKKSLRP